MTVIKRTDMNFTLEMAPVEQKDLIELAGYNGLSEEETLKHIITNGVIQDLRDWRADLGPHDDEE